MKGGKKKTGEGKEAWKKGGRGKERWMEREDKKEMPQLLVNTASKKSSSMCGLSASSLQSFHPSKFIRMLIK